MTASLTYFPQGGGAPTGPKDVTINAGEVKAIENILETFFGLTGTGGSIVLTTPTPASLIVGGKTYSNAITEGTYGQFIPGVVPEDRVGLGDSPLQVLQVEESPNYRSNLGLAELTGNSVKLKVSALVPDSSTPHMTTVDLPANGFTQLGRVLATLNPGNNTYNARITVRVIEGNGRVTAYASVIDNKTVDPTFIPAQK